MHPSCDKEHTWMGQQVSEERISSTNVDSICRSATESDDSTVVVTGYLVAAGLLILTIVLRKYRAAKDEDLLELTPRAESLRSHHTKTFSVAYVAREKANRLRKNANDWSNNLQIAVQNADEAFKANVNAQKALRFCIRQSDLADQQAQKALSDAEKAENEAAKLSLSRQEIS